MDTRKVLCVEDHPGHLRVLTRLLDAAGYQVVTAMTAQQALDLVRQQPVDGILLEYDLPDANGASLRSELKQIVPQIPVLLFSGVGQQTPILIRFFDAYLRDSHMRNSLPDALAG